MVRSTAWKPSPMTARTSETAASTMATSPLMLWRESKRRVSELREGGGDERARGEVRRTRTHTPRAMS